MQKNHLFLVKKGKNTENAQLWPISSQGLPNKNFLSAPRQGDHRGGVQLLQVGKEEGGDRLRRPGGPRQQGGVQRDRGVAQGGQLN